VDQLPDVGVDDKQTSGGSVVFQVFADGIKIYDSGVMGPTTATKSVNLSVANVQQLKLVVTDGGNGISFDHADWAGARVVLATQTPTPPAAPAGLATSVASSTQLNLTWTDVPTETGYRIERSTDNLTFSSVGSVGANVTTFSDLTALASTQYFYRVVATNAAGDSAPSNVATATTPAAPTAPAAPSNLVATPVSQTQINLTWTDNASDETGYIVERSPNGVDGWAQIGTPTFNATTFSDSTGLSANTSYWYRVRAVNAAGPSLDSNVASATTLPATGLPAGWSGGDVGAVGTAGSTTFGNGTYTVKGAGTDIWGNADSFHYAYRQVTGNATIVVRVASLSNTDPLAKAGIMFRESLAANAKQAGVFLTPSQGARFLRRTATGGATSSSGVSGPRAPYWLKLVRAGNTITAYSSPNGTTWTTVGSTTVSMGSTIYVGMAVTSKKTGTLATATFDNVSVV
jgi:hypothetical protein